MLRLLSRHRLVVGLVGLLSVGGLVAVLLAWPPTYQATAAVVLLNPPPVPSASVASPSIPAQYQNPFVQFNDLSVVVDIIVRVTSTEGAKASLKAKGFSGTFEIAANRDFYRGPIIDVAAESSSQTDAINGTRLLTKEIQDQLLSLQAAQGTDSRYFIKTGTVVGADRATTVFTGTVRILVAVGGFGVLLTIGSGLLADFLSRRRSERRVEVVRLAEGSESPVASAASSGR